MSAMGGNAQNMADNSLKNTKVVVNEIKHIIEVVKINLYTLLWF